MIYTKYFHINEAFTNLYIFLCRVEWTGVAGDHRSAVPVASESVRSVRMVITCDIQSGGAMTDISHTAPLDPYKRLGSLVQILLLSIGRPVFKSHSLKYSYFFAQLHLTSHLTTNIVAHRIFFNRSNQKKPFYPSQHIFSTTNL